MRGEVEWGFDQYVDEDEVGWNEPSHTRVISRVYERGTLKYLREGWQRGSSHGDDKTIWPVRA